MSLGLILNLLLIMGAVFMLFFGAEWLVRGGSNIARQLGVKPLVVGLTIVAFGTSMPEFVVSLIANVWRDSATIAIGNIIGSNITNVGLVLGMSALFFPISVHFSHVKRQLIFMTMTGILLYLLSLNGIISRFEGVIMVSLLILYVSYLYRHPEEAAVETIEVEDGSIVKNLFLVILGSVLLSLGAWLFVEGAVWIAEALGVPKLVVGLTVVALGTSLPELAASLVAAFRRHGDISVGNIIGSNIFNILFIMGGVGLVKPLTVWEKKIVAGQVVTYFPHAQYLIMLVFCLALFPLTFHNRIGRKAGTLLLLGYVGFYYYVFYDAMH